MYTFLEVENLVALSAHSVPTVALFSLTHRAATITVLSQTPLLDSSDAPKRRPVCAHNANTRYRNVRTVNYI